MRIRLHEPAVALTDLAIGIEAGAFGIALVRAGSRTVQRPARLVAIRYWFVAFFAATSLAALAGAALHGLLPAGDAPARRRLWRVSLGSIGVAGLSAWCLGAFLSLPRTTAIRIQRAAVAAHAVYLIGLARTNPPYAVAIATYLPGAFALAGGLLHRMRDPVNGGAATMGLAGLAMTFGAAAVQVRRIAVHPRLFDHNATYHTIQAIAIACFYSAARQFLQPGGRR